LPKIISQALPGTAEGAYSAPPEPLAGLRGKEGEDGREEGQLPTYKAWLQGPTAVQ